MIHRKHLGRLGLTLVLLTLVLAPISTAAPAPSAPETEPFVQGEILFQVKPGVSPSEMARAVGGNVLRSIGDGSIHLLKVADGAVPAVVKALNGRPGVVFAEPNWLRQLHNDPNDAGYDWKWDLNNDGSLCDGTDCAKYDADMDWQEAYDYLGSGFSGSAIVAVIDTGIDPNHPDLNDKIVPGYDYLDNDSDPTDTYGHGTHVAGIALAETNNGIGTAGVGYSPNIKVMPLRVCDSRGCPTDAVADAIYHAADSGAKVINLSLGGSTPSDAEEAAINYAWNKGLVIAASSGNDSASSVSYPAAFENCIAVGSTNWDDALASYSNTGSALDVVAPGGEMSALHDPGGIYSTMPTYSVTMTSRRPRYSMNYDWLQGTSMAAPQVSGLAGLLFAMGVSDNAQVRWIIESTADNLGPAGKDPTYGWGRINVYNAVVQAAGGGGNEPPTVTITSPADGATFDSGASISFAGTASDTEDGNLTKDLIWTSSLDGQIGTGGSFSTVLGDGTHTITASVTDSGNSTGTDSITVVVSSGGGGGTLYVFDIAMSGSRTGVNRSATAVVTIYDTDGEPVQGATVEGTWSGDFSSSVSDMTEADGTVSFASGRVKKANATFTFTVTDVVKAGYAYDSELNNETSASITVP